MPEKIGTSIQQMAQEARSENGQKMFEVIWQEKRGLCCQLGQVGCAAERFGGTAKKMSGHKTGNTNFE